MYIRINLMDSIISYMNSNYFFNYIFENNAIFYYLNNCISIKRKHFFTIIYMIIFCYITLYPLYYLVD